VWYFVRSIAKGEDDKNDYGDTQKSGISNAHTPEEIADYWDSHSLANHWDKTHEVEFEVRAQRPRRTTVDPKISERPEET
jgi:hypothetical protein